MSRSGRRPARPRVGGLAAAIVLGSLVAACSTSAHSAAVHRATHTAMAPLRGGTPVELASFAGRPLVVNEWASWCVPCRSEMPMLEAASRRLGGHASIVGVSSDPSRPGMIAAARRAGVTYPLLVDKDAAVQSDLAVDGLPTTYFFDAGGRLVDTHTGQLSASALRSELDRLGLHM